VIGNEVDQDLQAKPVGLLDEVGEICQGPVLGIDVAVIGDVVPMILLRRGIEGRDPDRVDSEVFDVTEPGGDAGQVADPVVVRVGEAPYVDLIEDGAHPPRARQRLATLAAEIFAPQSAKTMQEYCSGLHPAGVLGPGYVPGPRDCLSEGCHNVGENIDDLVPHG
jgi:hypothetical protein